MGQSVTWHDRRRQRALQARGLRTYEDFISAQIDTLVWERSSTKTLRLTAVDSEGDRPTGFYLKKYVHPDSRWTSLFRRDKPTIEQRNYEYLRREVGDVVPEVVVTGQRRRWLMLQDAFIVTTELAGCEQLDEYARAHWSGCVNGCERGRLDSLIRATADLVRRMHATGFYHIDLQWRNVLVRFSAPTSDAEVFVIDAPRGGRRWLWLRRRHGQLRDLSSLDKLARHYLTRTQRLRWFTLYTGRRRISRFDRRLIGAILADRSRYERNKVRLLADHG